MFKVVIEGAAELDKALRELPDRAARQVYRQALTEGAEIVKQEAQAGAGSRLGGLMGAAIARAFKIANQRKRRGGVGVTLLLDDAEGALICHTKGGKRYFIPTAIEYGHASPGRGGTGEKTTPPNPFFRTAWDRVKQKALAIVVNALRAGIEAIAAKAAAKTARAERKVERGIARTARHERKAARFLGIK